MHSAHGMCDACCWWFANHCTLPQKQAESATCPAGDPARLLAALKAMIGHDASHSAHNRDPGPEVCPICTAARAAIAKAEGK